jgi:hypothetical protein
MDTLDEIEAAVESLPVDKKEELLRFIAAQLREQPVSSQRHEFSRSKRGFPVSKGRVLFTSADVARVDSES